MVTVVNSSAAKEFGPLQEFPWENLLSFLGMQKSNPRAGMAKMQIGQLIGHPLHTKSPGAAAPAPFTKGGRQTRTKPRLAMPAPSALVLMCRIWSGVSGSLPQ